MHGQLDTLQKERLTVGSAMVSSGRPCLTQYTLLPLGYHQAQESRAVNFQALHPETATGILIIWHSQTLKEKPNPPPSLAVLKFSRQEATAI